MNKIENNIRKRKFAPLLTSYPCSSVIVTERSWYMPVNKCVYIYVQEHVPIYLLHTQEYITSFLL